MDEDIVCRECTEFQCYQLTDYLGDFDNSTNCERNVDCCLDGSSLSSTCRRCDNCTEEFVNYGEDSCSCFTNEEDCCIADIEYDRNCVWNSSNTTSGGCNDRVIVPAPTYLGIFASLFMHDL